MIWVKIVFWAPYICDPSRKVREDVEIHNLPVRTSISMPKLSKIDEDLEMSTLKIIGEDLFLGGMAVSSDLSMSKLTKVEGSFWLYNMPYLSEPKY